MFRPAPRYMYRQSGVRRFCLFAPHLMPDSRPMPPQARRSGPLRQQAGSPAAWLPWALAAVLICSCVVLLTRRSPPQPASNGGLRLTAVLRPTARGRTLVVYVFSGSDPEYADNLRFFIGEAVQVRRQSWRFVAACVFANSH